MKAREVARRVSIREFTTICSWLDVIYGKDARRFEVIAVERAPKSNVLLNMKVVLLSGRVVDILPEQVTRECKRKLRERERSDVA